MRLSYRALLALAGARSLALICAVGWLGWAGYSLAVILAVHAASGSFAEAGGAVAAFAAGSAIAAPARGRQIDRRGPRALAFFAVGHAAASAALVACCVLQLGVAPLLMAAGLAGLLAPPLIATARRVWGDVAGELTATAHALNSALGDGGSLVGPAATGGLAAAVSPSFAFAVLAGVASGAAVVLAVRWGATTVQSPAKIAGSKRRLLLAVSPGLVTLLLTDAAFGVAFGAIEVAVTALCARTHTGELAAVPLSAYAVGSVALSLWSGTGRLKSSLSARYLAGCWLTATALLLLLAVKSIAAVSCILAVSGAGIGLATVALYELLDEVVPKQRAVEAFTWLTTGQAAGMAAGAALSGQLTNNGAGAAFTLAGAAAIAAAIVVTARLPTLRRSVEPMN